MCGYAGRATEATDEVPTPERPSPIPRPPGLQAPADEPARGRGARDACSSACCRAGGRGARRRRRGLKRPDAPAPAPLIKTGFQRASGYHLTDALAKLRGLAAYAERHGDVFQRVDAVIQEPGGQLLALDLKSEAIREAVLKHDHDVLSLFVDLAGHYS